jgi:hypothetical protein
MTSHRYRGQTIVECERAPGEHPQGRWVWITYHPTGLPFADELNPHFGTLAEAKRRIAEWSLHYDRNEQGPV